MPYDPRALLLSLLPSLLAGRLLHAQGGRMPPAAPALSAEQTDGLVAHIRHQEYRFEAVKNERGAWSAPNRAQGLRSRVSERGFEVFPRATGADGEGALWKLRLATASFGRADGSFELPRASVNATGERIELDHGYFVEWFVNDERGIEQGWTIPERLIGSEALSIGLAIEGELELRIEEGGRSGVLVDACGEAVLRYRDLVAFDATGRELDARFVPQTAGVAVLVDDAGAVYPLTVDPLLTEPAWMVESEADGFGYAVTTAGDVNGDGYPDVIIGAPWFDGGQLDEGRVFAFHGSSTGLATSPSWTAESNLTEATFGFAVSTAGDVNGDGYSDVIIGAPYAYSFDFGGRAYAYHGGPGGLSASPAWTVQGGEQFAYSVSTAGDVNGDGYSDVIVPGLDVEGDDELSIYHGSSAGLSATPVVASFGGPLVSTAGDVDGDGYSDVVFAVQYAVVVVRGSPTGLVGPLWIFEYPFEEFPPPPLMLAGTTAGDVNGDGYGDLVVGVYEYYASYYGTLEQGEAFAFLGSASGLSSSPDWTVEPFQFDGIYRGSISTAGDVNGDGYSDVILGEFEYAGSLDEGRAYLYYGGPAGLDTTPFSIPNPPDPERFGLSMSTAGDVNGDGYADVILGSGTNDVGRAYVFHGAADGLSTSAAWSDESDQAGAQLGVSVACAGDVNGDGYSDVIAGASLYDGGDIDEGRAFLYHGSADGPSITPSWIGGPGQGDALFGASVASAGDANGDGYSDVIVGAPGYDNGEINEGRSFVYHGSASGLAASPAWTAESNQAEANFGDNVAGAGDVNGDGYSDAIVGAAFYDGGQADEGRAYVYHGSASGLAASPAWTAESNQVQAYFGASGGCAGDVNGDGYSDVIVSAYSYDAGQLNEGRVYAYHGSASGLPASPSWTVESNEPFAHMGFRVSTAGDVNGDGFSDVIVGAPLSTNAEFLEGRAFAYHGSASGLASSPAWTAESNQMQAWFGFSVSTAGDVNGDGYSDVIVGAYQYDAGESDEGRAFAYLGSASGIAVNPAWTAEANQTGAGFGSSVSTAGDVNGDGYSDVIVGAYQYDGSDVDEGRIWVYLGNEGRGGMIQGLQQRTSDGQSPLSLQGSAGVSGAFQIHAEFPTSAAPGASTAQLEWEVKAMGVPFDGQGVESGTPQPLGPGGGPLVFDELVTPADVGRSFLTRATIYRWRARIATDDPLRPHTPWFSVPGNALTEAKLRKSALRFR